MVMRMCTMYGESLGSDIHTTTQVLYPAMNLVEKTEKISVLTVEVRVAGGSQERMVLLRALLRKRSTVLSLLYQGLCR